MALVGFVEVITEEEVMLGMVMQVEVVVEVGRIMRPRVKPMFLCY